MNKNNLNENTTNEVQKGSKKNNRTTLLLLGVFVVLIGVVFFQFLQKENSKDNIPTVNIVEGDENNNGLDEVSPTPEPIVTDEPTNVPVDENTPVVKEPTDNNGETVDDVSEDPVVEPSTPPKEDGENIQNNNIVEVIGTSELPKYDSTKQHGLPNEYADVFRTVYRSSLWDTNYLPSINYRVDKVDHKNKELTITITNTSSKNFTVDKSTFEVGTYGNGVNLSDAYMVGGDYTLSPNETKTFTFKWTYEDTKGIFGKIDGQDIQINISKNDLYRESISDTTPLNTKNDLVNYQIEENGKMVKCLSNFGREVIGNGLYKFQVNHVQFTENNNFGKIKKPNDGYLSLAYLELANTSNEKMIVNSYKVYITEPNSFNNVIQYELTPQEFKETMGDIGIPTEIDSNTIAKGYVPFVHTHSLEYASIVINTNLGYIHIMEIDTYPPLEWMQ